MKKKVCVIFILAMFIFACGFIGISPTKSAFAESSNLNEDLVITSKSAILLDKYSNTVIYSKNDTERLPIASMCKIMTLNLIFNEIENGRLSIDEKIIVSKNASSMGGSQIFLEENGEYPIKTLIEGIVVASANDACVALAERICGSESEFVAQMNQFAVKLGMNDTLFANCTGLPKPTQYSCAKDVAIMFSNLLNYKDYFEYSLIWMDTVKHPRDRITEISNTNKLIKFYQGCDSGKTGYTSEAGHCIATSAERNGMRLISVVIKAPDSKSRFRDASSLFDYGFNNYSLKKFVNCKEKLNSTINILNGTQEQIEIIPEKDLSFLVKKGEKRGFEIDISCEDKIFAPINQGDRVGEIIVYENNVEIARVNLLSNVSVSKSGYLDNVKKITENWYLVG